MCSLAEVLAAGAVPTLERLQLSSNDIGDVGAAHLASALPHLTNLVELMLDDNAISDKGLASLAQAFARGALPVLRLGLG
jgi:Ran GTPase-activating protein (RanGAP) involved in mRNA processing and transport